MIPEFVRRGRVRAVAVGADAIMLAAVISLLANAFGSESTGLAATGILIWAPSARILGAGLDVAVLSRGDANATLRRFGLLIFIATLIFLAETGWALVHAAAGGSDASDGWATFAIFVTWFGSCFAGSADRRRVLDGIVLTSVVVAGVRDAEPFVPLVAITFAGMGMSAALRQLSDTIYHDVHRPWIPWRPVLSRAATTLVIILAAFIALESMASVWLDRPIDETEEAPEPFDPNVPPDLVSGSGPSVDELPTVPERPERDRPVATGEPEGDPLVPLFEVRAARPGDVIAFTPGRMRLWRTEVADRYDARSGTWSTTAMPSGREDLSTGATLELTAPDALDFDSRSIRISFVVQTRSARSIPQPYFVDRLILGSRAGHAIRHEASQRIEIVPPLAIGETAELEYRSRIARSAVVREIAFRETGSHADERYLELPPESDFGLVFNDLVAKPQSAETIGESIVRVRRRFEDEGLIQAPKVAPTSRLSALRAWSERIGSSEDFATIAAMSLRHLGVSTRVARGFRAAYPEPAIRGEVDTGPNGERTWWLVFGDEHAWIEVFVPEAGWIPIDPSEWGRPSVDDVRSDGLTTLTDTGTIPTPPVEGDELAGPANESTSGTGEPGVVDDGSLRPGGADLATGPEGGPSDGDPTNPSTEAESEFDVSNGGEEAIVSNDPETSDGTGGENEASVDAGSQPDEVAAAEPRGPGNEVPIDVVDGGDDESSSASVGFWIIRGLLLLGAVVAGLHYFRRSQKKQEEEEDGDLDAEALARKTVARIDDLLARTREVPIDDLPEDVIRVYLELQRELAKDRQERQLAETPLEHAARFGAERGLGVRALETLVVLVYRHAYSTQRGADDLASARRASSAVLGGADDSGA